MELTTKQHSACASAAARGSSYVTPSSSEACLSLPNSSGIGTSPHIIAERARKARHSNWQLSGPSPIG